MKLKNSKSNRRRMRSRKQGLPPGSIEATAAVVAPSQELSHVTVIEFSPTGFKEYELKKPEDLKSLNLTDDVVRWINVYGVSDVAWLKVLGEVLEADLLRVMLEHRCRTTMGQARRRVRNPFFPIGGRSVKISTHMNGGFGQNRACESWLGLGRLCLFSGY